MFGALTKGLSKIGNTVASGVGKVPGMGGLAGGMKATINRGIGPSTPPPQGGMLNSVKQMGAGMQSPSPMQPPQMGQGGMMGPMLERLMREQPPPPGWTPPPYDPNQATDQGGWGNYQPKPIAPRQGMLQKIGKFAGR